MNVVHGSQRNWGDTKYPITKATGLQFKHKENGVVTYTYFTAHDISCLTADLEAIKIRRDFSFFFFFFKVIPAFGLFGNS